MYKIYDKVILKDGRIAIITDFFEDNYSCVFEIQTNDNSNIIANNYRRLTSHWRRQWHPTPVLLPGKSHERRSLVGCSPLGREESDTTE